MEQVNKFMLYASNYQMKLFCINNSERDIYAPECLIATKYPDNLAEKFHNLAVKTGDGTMAFLRLWHQFDGGDKTAIINWINKN